MAKRTLEALETARRAPGAAWSAVAIRIEELSLRIGVFLMSKEGKFAAALAAVALLYFRLGGGQYLASDDNEIDLDKLIVNIMTPIRNGVVTLGICTAVFGGIKTIQSVGNEDADGRQKGIMTIVGGGLLAGCGFLFNLVPGMTEGP